MFEGKLDESFTLKLYRNRPRCLHVPSYLIWNGVQAVCGPCYFRDGVQDELPTRMTIREASGLFGAPQFDPRTIEHLMVSVGLVPPDPDESMERFRRRRRTQSKPSPNLYPFTTALWRLMGYQPPLARVLVQFCQGLTEIEIARSMDLSLFNVQDRLRKSVHTSKKYLKNAALT